MKRTLASLICGVLIISLFSIPQSIKAEEDKTELQQKEETTEVIQEDKEKVIEEEDTNEETTSPEESDMGEVFLAFNLVDPVGDAVLYDHVTVKGKIGTQVQFPKELPKYFDEDVTILDNDILNGELFEENGRFIVVFVYINKSTSSAVFYDIQNNGHNLDASASLAKAQMQTGSHGSEYTIQVPEIEGYKLKKIMKDEYIINEKIKKVETDGTITYEGFNTHASTEVSLSEIVNNEIKGVLPRGFVDYSFMYEKVVDTVKPVEEKDKTKEKKKDSVNTGVDNSMIFYIGLGAVAVLTGIFVVVKKKKKS